MYRLKRSTKQLKQLLGVVLPSKRQTGPIQGQTGRFSFHQSLPRFFQLNFVEGVSNSESKIGRRLGKTQQLEEKRTSEACKS